MIRPRRDVTIIDHSNDPTSTAIEQIMYTTINSVDSNNRVIPDCLGRHSVSESDPRSSYVLCS